MKLQLTPRFPARVVGAGGISVSVANGVYTISLNASAPYIMAADGAIPNGTGLVAVVRNNPVVTNLSLPSILNQANVPLSIIDWSTNVINHQIILTPFGVETIMRAANWSIYSNAAQLAGLTLYPSTTLNGWFLAP